MITAVAQPCLITLFFLTEHNMLSIPIVNYTTDYCQAPYLVYNRYLKQEIKILSATEVTMQFWTWLILFIL